MSSSKLTNRRTRIRIEHIADLMRRNEFRSGTTGKALAKEWGLGDRWIKELTAAASKMVLAELIDPERVKPDLCDILMRSAKAAFDAKQYGNVAQVVRVYGEILGLRAERHGTLRVTVEPGEVSPQRARELIANEFSNAVAVLAGPSENKEN